MQHVGVGVDETVVSLKERKVQITAVLMEVGTYYG